MKGRRPIPKAIQKAKGTYKIHPERENKLEPDPQIGWPPKPEEVESDWIASKKWDQLCKTLEELRILVTCDYDVLALYAITYSQYRRALASVNKTGQVLIQKDRESQVRAMRNPYSIELHKYMDRLKLLITELGLSPTSRSRIHAAPAEDEHDPLIELLARRGVNLN